MIAAEACKRLSAYITPSAVCEYGCTAAAAAHTRPSGFSVTVSRPFYLSPGTAACWLIHPLIRQQ